MIIRQEKEKKNEKIFCPTWLKHNLGSRLSGGLDEAEPSLKTICYFLKERGTARCGGGSIVAWLDCSMNSALCRLLSNHNCLAAYSPGWALLTEQQRKKRFSNENLIERRWNGMIALRGSDQNIFLVFVWSQHNRGYCIRMCDSNAPACLPAYSLCARSPLSALIPFDCRKIS